MMGDVLPHQIAEEIVNVVQVFRCERCHFCNVGQTVDALVPHVVECTFGGER